MNDLKDKEFVILDVETTGLSPLSGDRVIEIGLLKIKNEKIIDRFETLINPGREIFYDAFLVNRISQEMLEGAPYAPAVLPQVLEFMGEACLIGHNIKFDLKFLNYELLLAGHSPLEEIATIDTGKMAKALLPDLGSYALGNLAYSFNIGRENHHRAMGDVEMTFKVFKRLLKVAEDKNIFRLDVLNYLFGIQKPSLERNHLTLRMIQEALAVKSSLNLIYFTTGSGITQRRITPVELIGRGRQATLVAFCHLRNEERNFKIERILNLEKLA